MNTKLVFDFSLLYFVDSLIFYVINVSLHPVSSIVFLCRNSFWGHCVSLGSWSSEMLQGARRYGVRTGHVATPVSRLLRVL